MRAVGLYTFMKSLQQSLLDSRAAMTSEGLDNRGCGRRRRADRVLDEEHEREVRGPRSNVAQIYDPRPSRVFEL